MLVLNVLHRPDDFIASTQPWCGVFVNFAEWLKDWISRNVIIKIWQITSCSCCSCRPNAERFWHVIQWFSQCTVITLLPLVAKPNLCLCIKLVKKGYKTNIPSFYFERIVGITYLRRTGKFSIFPQIYNSHYPFSKLGIFVYYSQVCHCL